MTIHKIAEYSSDGFLGLLHCLLLMDDTVIFATLRTLLMEATNKTIMTIYPTKSKYFAVNTGDQEPFILGDVVMSYQDLYIYLGSPISNSTIKKQVINHAVTNQFHIRKISSLLAKNCDASFVVKKVVWESPLFTAILYSCETWMIKGTTEVQTQYMSSDLLGVRTQTPNNLIYVERDIPSVQALVRRRQISFLKKAKNTTHFEGSPLQKAIQNGKGLPVPCGTLFQRLRSLG